MRQSCSRSWSVGLCVALSLVPSFAAASELPEGALVAKWALPLFVGDALLLAASAFALGAVGWNRLGFLIWIVGLTVGGCVFVYGMPHALNEPKWQLPAFMFGTAVLVVVAEQARKRLSAKSE
jgi:lysylphosphatidylglycerol synthetase-like protein (DUF2156 family)